jgi:hypothetical protein
VLVAPVAAVDGVVAEDFAGVLVDDGDGVGIDEDVSGEPAWGCADAEVVHAAGAAEADLAEAVDVIGADSHRLDRAGVLPNAPGGLLQRLMIIASFAWMILLAVRLLRRKQPAVTICRQDHEFGGSWSESG